MDLEVQQVEIDVSDIMLMDIEDREVKLGDFKGRPVLLVGAGREGADEARKWGKELLVKCKEYQEVEYSRIAFVGKLPAFVPRKFIKGLLKSSSSASTPLIAWDNEPAEKLGVSDSKTPYIFMVDRDGILRFRFKGSYTGDNLEKITEYFSRVAGS